MQNTNRSVRIPGPPFIDLLQGPLEKLENPPMLIWPLLSQPGTVPRGGVDRHFPVFLTISQLYLDESLHERTVSSGELISHTRSGIPGR